MDIEYKNDDKIPHGLPFKELSPGETFFINGRLCIKVTATTPFGLIIDATYGYSDFAINLENGEIIVFAHPNDQVHLCRTKVIVED